VFSNNHGILAGSTDVAIYFTPRAAGLFDCLLLVSVRPRFVTLAEALTDLAGTETTVAAQGADR